MPGPGYRHARNVGNRAPARTCAPGAKHPNHFHYGPRRSADLQGAPPSRGGRMPAQAVHEYGAFGSLEHGPRQVPSLKLATGKSHGIDMDSGALVSEGGRLKPMSDGTSIVYVVDDDVS